MFKGCSKGAFRSFGGCFRSILRVFQGYFKDLSWMLKGCLECVTIMVFQGCFKEVSRTFLKVFQSFQADGRFVYLVTTPLRLRQCVSSSGAHLQ